MFPLIIIILISIGSTIVVGLLLGNVLYKRKYKKRQEEVEEKIKLITREAEIAAENLKRDRILEAKEKILKMKKSNG